MRLHLARAHVVLLSLVTAACATQPDIPRLLKNDPPGFFSALFHGVTAPVALLVGLFSDARVYAFPNSGFSYDLGYLIGILSWGVALALLLRRRGEPASDF